MENKKEFDIEEYSKKVFDIEFIESPNSVDLRSCMRGDELLCKDGTIIYYVQPESPDSFYDHQISYDLAGKKLGTRTHSGRILKASNSDSDIIQIIRKY